MLLLSITCSFFICKSRELEGNVYVGIKLQFYEKVSVRELLMGISMSGCNIHCFLLYFQSPRAHKRQGLSSPARDAEKRVCMALPFYIPLHLLTHAVGGVCL